MGGIQNAYNFSFQKETHATLVPGRSCFGQVPRMSSWEGSAPSAHGLLWRSVRGTCCHSHGPEVKCVPTPRPEVASCVLGFLESSKSQPSQIPRVKDFPQVETHLLEASKTNSDKQTRRRKLAGSQLGAGCQVWGGESPEET